MLAAPAFLCMELGCVGHTPRVPYSFPSWIEEGTTDDFALCS